MQATDRLFVLSRATVKDHFPPARYPGLELALLHPGRRGAIRKESLLLTDQNTATALESILKGTTLDYGN